MHMPHKSRQERQAVYDVLERAREIERERQRKIERLKKRSRGEGVQPLHELFCGFWQCQDTRRHDTTRKLTKLVGGRRRGSEGSTRDAANKTKQNEAKAKQSKTLLAALHTLAIKCN